MVQGFPVVPVVILVLGAVVYLFRNKLKALFTSAQTQATAKAAEVQAQAEAKVASVEAQVQAKVDEVKAKVNEITK